MPSSPGWYPDPNADPDPPPRRHLRYWDGRVWTDRRRPQPVLTTLELSGLAGAAARQELRAIERPVRAAELPAPAPAAEVGASTQDAPAGRPTGPAGEDRPGTPPTAPARGRADPPGGPPDPPGPPGGGGDGEGDGPGADRSKSPTRSRRRWWFLAGVAVLGAVAIALVGQALKPTYGPRVLTDGHFVQLANDECTRTMAKLRPADTGPLGRVQSPADAARQIDTAATGLDDLANHLAALPLADSDRTHVGAWLDGWHGFAGVGHTYADYLRQHGANQRKPPAVLADGARLARTADNFALANGLKSCTFAVVPLMDPSTM